MVRRLLTGFLVGGLAGAVLVGGVFLLMAALDGTLTKETIFL